MSTAIPVRPKDWIRFRCRLCGGCCRNVKGQLMLEPIDAYRLARLLRECNEVEFMEDVNARYAYQDILEGCYPIFLLNTTAPDDACVFLRDGRCSVYKARLKVCRLYPFSVFPGTRGKDFSFYQCMDQHAFHFSDSKVLVKDWMHQNLKQEERAFLLAEGAALLELGRLVRTLGNNRLQENLFQILYYHYYNYDLDHPFMPQYIKNVAELKGILQDAVGR